MDGLQREKTKPELIEEIKSLLSGIEIDAMNIKDLLKDNDIKGAQDYLARILGVK